MHSNLIIGFNCFSSCVASDGRKWKCRGREAKHKKQQFLLLINSSETWHSLSSISIWKFFSLSPLFLAFSPFISFTLFSRWAMTVKCWLKKSKFQSISCLNSLNIGRERERQSLRGGEKSFVIKWGNWLKIEWRMVEVERWKWDRFEVSLIWFYVNGDKERYC